MKRTFLFAAMMLLLSYGAAQAQTAAPSPTPRRVIPLTSGQNTTGVLNNLEQVVYQFKVPAHTDVVLDYSADHIVMVNDCAQEYVGQSNCQSKSGGGDGPDSPTVGTIYLPSSESDQTMLFTLWRPLPEQTHYQVKIAPVVPKDVTLGASLTIPKGDLYQSYRLEADPAQPFVVEIEDVQANGAFLWAANQPYKRDVAPLAATEEPLPAPIYVDSARNGTNLPGVQAVSLSYLGAQEFRIFVQAAGGYVLNITPLNEQVLGAGSILPLTLSYRNPLALVRLDTQHGVPIAIAAQVEQGKGAYLDIFPGEGGIVERLLGTRDSTGKLSPLATTVQGTLEGNKPLYAVVQIANGSTRAPIHVTMQWGVSE